MTWRGIAWLNVFTTCVESALAYAAHDWKRFMFIAFACICAAVAADSFRRSRRERRSLDGTMTLSEFVDRVQRGEKWTVAETVNPKGTD
jgi:hypothetical protein